ncbi:non-ribosomal peptide synthetase [Zooshikella harenae]|uniref:Amino acid adenylation domain-containing protein n=1 Tax=Zooshikella harenae TaxID=2827238 RepID=A0ABS5ZBF2_9GAMM|nr:non-ribosomal peptide synthetase [Zooshikella harenae]MBU2711093.1 amino acid adenylation domain-containing protein [Zooshikella harenae]
MKFEHYPLHPEQRAIYFDQCQDTTSTKYTLGVSIKLQGVLDKEALSEAVSQVIQSLDFAGLRFTIVDNVPKQYNAQRYPELSIIDFSEALNPSQQLQSWLKNEVSRKFSLERDSLVRVMLLSESDQRHVLVVLAHHIVVDGYGIINFVNSLGEAYAANVQCVEWQENGLNYLPCVIDSEVYCKTQAYQRSEVYWKKTVQSYSPNVELLPLKYMGDFNKGVEKYSCTMPSSLKEAMFATSTRLNIGGPLALCLAGLALHFSIYQQSSVVTLGSILHKRKGKNQRNVVGMFAGVLPFYITVNHSKSCSDLIKHVAQVIKQVYRHQYVSTSQIKHVSGINERLFDVLFSYNTFALDSDFNGLLYQLDEIYTDDVNCPLNIRILDQGDCFGQQLAITYRKDYFTSLEISLLAKRLLKIWEFMTENTDQLLGAIDICCLDEYKQLLNWSVNSLDVINDLHDKEKNNFNHDVTLNEQEKIIKKVIVQGQSQDNEKTILEYKSDYLNHWLEHNSVIFPNNPAMFFAGKTITYKDFNEQANQLAHYLINKGVKPNELVGIYLERSPAVFIAMMAALKVGAGYLPLSTALPDARLRYIINDSQCQYVISEKAISHTLERLLPECQDACICIIDDDIFYKKLQGLPKDNLQCERPVPTENCAYAIYTSGTTGQPKGVLVSHANVINLFGAAKCFNVNPNSRILQFAAITFDASVLEWGIAFYSGACLYLLPKSVNYDPWLLNEQVNQLGITHAFLTPGLLPSLDVKYWSGLQQLFIGGEACNVQVAEEWSQKISLINIYGPTETTICATLGGYQAQQHKLPIGKPIKGYSVYVLDKLQHLLPMGAVGELYIGGNGVTLGYLGQPDLTAKKFCWLNPFAEISSIEAKQGKQRLYATGDLVRWLPDGNLEFVGRTDDQVKIRGFRIELGEIKLKLEQLTGVCQAAVSTEVEDDSHCIIAFLVCDADIIKNESKEGEIIDNKDENKIIQRLREQLQQNLPDYMLPSKWYIVDKLPLNVNGKVDYRALSLMVEKKKLLVSATQESDIFSSDTERQIGEIWKTLLPHQSAIKTTDNFFRLGGHSLLVMKMVGAIRHAFSVEISVSHIFAKPTIKGIAKAILQSQNEDKAQGVIKPVDRSKKHYASYAQRSLWFLDHMEQGSTHYNMPAAYHIQGPIDDNALNYALTQIITRHETLRTQFVLEQGDVLQTILPPPRENLIQVVKLVSDSYTKATCTDELWSEVNKLRYEEIFESFNLTDDSYLVRVKRLDLGCEKGNILLITFHHIAADGWSVALFIQELQFFYQQFFEKKSQKRLPLSYQYVDYSAWQRQWLNSSEAKRQANYWRQQLAELPKLHQLPLDYSRPDRLQHKGGLFHAKVSFEKLTQLQRLCEQQGVSVFSGVYALFTAFLYRFTGEQDVVIGTPMANRENPAFSELIGYFVNTVVLRWRVNGGYTFNQLLNESMQVVQGAYTHQHFPFERVVELIQPERSLSFHPLFQIMLTVEDDDNTSFTLGDQQATVLSYPELPAKFDLSLQLTKNDKGADLLWEFNRELFSEGTIAQFNQCFLQLFQQLMSTPDQALDQCLLHTEIQQQQWLTQQFDQWLLTYPKTICDLFNLQGHAQSGHIAVQAGNDSITYLQLQTCALRLAQQLIACGIQSEDSIGVLTHHSIDWVVAMLGIWYAGGIYVPLDPKYPDERLHFILQDAQIKHVISEPALMTRGHSLITLSDGLLNTSDALTDYALIQSNDEACGLMNGIKSQKHVNTKQLSYIIYTSGSTGIPKGVLIEHHSFARHIQEMIDWYQLNGTDRVLAFANIGFDASLEQAWEALGVGATLVMREESLWSAEAFRQWLITHQITHIDIPPVYAQEVFTPVLQDIEFWQLQTRLARVVVGGEALNANFAQQWAASVAVNHCDLLNAYGPTEATIAASIYKVPAGFKGENVPIGQGLSHVQLVVLDSLQRVVPGGAIGELYIGGEGVARGYLNRSSLNETSFINYAFADNIKLRLYRTGDLVRVLADGNVCFLSRVDNQVKLRGYRIELGEIESALTQQTMVDQACVVLHAPNTPQAQLVAYIILNNADNSDNNQSLSEKKTDIITALRMKLVEHLPSYMVPAAYVIISALPLTVNGKVDHHLLPEPKQNDFYSTQEYTAPTDTLEVSLCEVWQQLLGHEQLSITADFFELGGHSMLAVKMVSEIKQRLNAQITVQTVFAHPTIQQLARYLHLHKLDDAGGQVTGNQVNSSCLSEDNVVADDWLLHAKNYLHPINKMDNSLRAGALQYALLTGVTGYVGGYLLHQLLVQNDHVHCYCLVRAEDEFSGLDRVKIHLQDYDLWQPQFADRISVLVGDLSSPKLGLTDIQWDTLSSELDLILHNGARVNHLLPYTCLEAANVGSTLELLSLAVKRPACRFVFISTSGVFNTAAKRPYNELSSICEQQHAQNGGYLASKWVAEQLVEEAYSQGMNVQLVRLGRVGMPAMHPQLGNTTDVIARYMQSCLMLNCVPMLSFKEHFIPVDYTATAIVTLLQQSFSEHVFHLLGCQQVDWNLLLAKKQGLKTISLAEWQVKAEAWVSSGKELPFAPYLFSGLLDFEAGQAVEVTEQQTQCLLHQLGLQQPVLSPEALSDYIDAQSVAISQKMTCQQQENESARYATEEIEEDQLSMI